MSDGVQESCPRCATGLMYPVARAETVDTLHCFNCEHNETRPAEGYQLDPDTHEIVKSPKAPSSPKGGRK